LADNYTKLDVNYIYFNNFTYSECFKIVNFFEAFSEIREKSSEFPYSEYLWEDTVTYVQEDLYNYFYIKFLWDYSLYTEDMEAGVDFDYIYIVFYKNEPVFNYSKNKSYELGIENPFIFYTDSSNILYFEKISISDLKELRTKFVNAYKENEFDDLHNSINNFTSNIILHLQELYFEEVLIKNKDSSLFLNMIIPNKKDISLPIKNKPNNYHSKKRFYSTCSKANNITTSVENRLKIKNNLNFNYYLSKRCFSCSVRTYSLEDKKMKIKTNVSQNKSFKMGSPIFNDLNTIISNNPINEETQRKIEQILFDYSYISLEIDSNKINWGVIDYSLINPSLTKILLYNEKLLIKLIGNFIKAHHQTVTSVQEETFNEIVANMFKVISNKTLISIMYGHLLKILYRHERQMTNVNAIADIFFALGRDVLNVYCYKEYLKVKERTSDPYYYLSTWKRAHKDLLDKFDEPTYLVDIGSLIVGWMINCKIIRQKTITIEKEKN